MENHIFGRFQLRPSAAASHEAAVLCLPPPYTSFPEMGSLTRDETAVSVPLRCPYEAWPETDARDPGLHLPPYSLHPTMPSFGGIPGALPFVAWETDPKNDRPPSYEESFRDTTVIHM